MTPQERDWTVNWIVDTMGASRKDAEYAVDYALECEYPRSKMLAALANGGAETLIYNAWIYKIFGWRSQ